MVIVAEKDEKQSSSIVPADGRLQVGWPTLVLLWFIAVIVTGRLGNGCSMVGMRKTDEQQTLMSQQVSTTPSSIVNLTGHYYNRKLCWTVSKLLRTKFKAQVLRRSVVIHHVSNLMISCLNREMWMCQGCTQQLWMARGLKIKSPFWNQQLCECVQTCSAHGSLLKSSHITLRICSLLSIS